jgi:hypothetical protein
MAKIQKTFAIVINENGNFYPLINSFLYNLYLLMRMDHATSSYRARGEVFFTLPIPYPTFKIKSPAGESSKANYFGGCLYLKQMGVAFPPVYYNIGINEN